MEPLSPPPTFSYQDQLQDAISHLKLLLLPEHTQPFVQTLSLSQLGPIITQVHLIPS